MDGQAVGNGRHAADHGARLSRRRAIQTTFCSSVALAMNLRGGRATAAIDKDAIHLLAIGDFGTTGKDQAAVAGAMRAFRRQAGLPLESLLLLGDNVYNRVSDGFSVASPHWRAVFEEMYPADDFPCPCYAVLGNHDYGDNPGGHQVQLDYSQQGGTRWRMPGKWYRFDVGGPSAGVTFLALDSNQSPKHLSDAERREQLAWLETQLAGPRRPFTIVMAHHPIYSNGKHGDTEYLVRDWAPLLERHKVHVYLAGHDHDLQHLELSERFTSFVISGGGGARTRSLTKKDRPVPFGRDALGFTHLEVRPDVIAFSHHGIDGRGLHRFEKRVDGSVRIDV
ncbi:MAG: metallophosphoesterase [Planctomycetia bacterium]